jgi:hypothetical protein
MNRTFEMCTWSVNLKHFLILAHSCFYQFGVDVVLKLNIIQNIFNSLFWTLLTPVPYCYHILFLLQVLEEHFKQCKLKCTPFLAYLYIIVKCIANDFEHFVRSLFFYGEGLLAPRPVPKLKEEAVRGYFFNVFADILHSWRPSLYPQPEDAPCCGGKGPSGSIKCWETIEWIHNWWPLE